MLSTVGQRTGSAYVSATLLTCAVWVLCGVLTANAQTHDVQISINSQNTSRITIEGRLSAGAEDWSFRNVHAGVSGLGERISGLSLNDDNGASVVVRKLTPGEYKSDAKAFGFRYEIKLDPPAANAAAAHVSWLSARYGVLMLGDLLPVQSSTRASVKLKLPANWGVSSTEQKTSNSVYEVSDPEQVLFFVGENLRERGFRDGDFSFLFATIGAWAFDDGDAASLAMNLFREHRRVIGRRPRKNVLTVVAPFPHPAESSEWSAETRGATVFLLAGRAPSKNVALAQLSTPLAHELLHLWVPNDLTLSGDYDWFYEGFTLYQAMRVAMRLGYLNFHDYLKALGRAYDGYFAAEGHGQFSLVDASRRRWTGAEALIYNKGMLVAFLYDLTLRQQTQGTKSMDDIYRKLLRHSNRAGERREGNLVVIETLESMPGMTEFTTRHVESSMSIDLPASVQPFGLLANRFGARTHVSVAETLSRAQRSVLAGLGYSAQP
ncbi:MAG: hypothetical protein H0W76_15810 [Pyrinomonadaceae bacterium]|nr:hypothetical protein [Pyrinomonadaceae bacterium]